VHRAPIAPAVRTASPVSIIAIAFCRGPTFFSSTARDLRRRARHVVLATGDLDGDGRPEILIVNMNDRPRAAEERRSPAECDRDYANRDAVEPQRDRRSMHGGGGGAASRLPTWSAAASYYSQNSFVLYFGIGKAEQVDRIEVRWPTGEKQSWVGDRAQQDRSS